MDDWEDPPQTVFRPAAFVGDAGFALLIGVWGAGHGGYVKRMHVAVEALSEGRTRLDVKLCQLVNLMRNGEPVKMSKPSGEFVTLRDVVDEVGRTRFVS